MAQHSGGDTWSMETLGLHGTRGGPVDPTRWCAENIEQGLLEPLRVTVLEEVFVYI